MKGWLCVTLACSLLLGLLLGLTQGVGLNYPLPVVGSRSWFDRGSAPVSDAHTVSFLMRSIQFDPARAAPLKFLVFDFALTAHNIGPPGQQTGTDGPFAELKLKAGNSKQRHRAPFSAKLLAQPTEYENRGSATAFS